MKTSIWKEYRFEAAHRLAFLPETHKCHALHGHTYVVRLTVTGEMMGPWLLDFSQLSSIWEQVCDKQLDHRYLNDVEGLSEPTAEVIANWIAQRVSLALPPRLTLSEVEVRETPTSGAKVQP
jgi:6-pyruvoyltetrahydropterin/6-carboxytetrahydropterin synthase